MYSIEAIDVAKYKNSVGQLVAIAESERQTPITEFIGIISKAVENSQLKKNSRASVIADAAYLDAVKRGDMETTQRMVDEAAKAAGYTIEAYHGTDAKFNVFKSGEKNGWLGKGIYFAENKKYAKENGKKVITAYINPEMYYVYRA